MKTAFYSKYGGPEVLEIIDREIPELKDDEVLLDMKYSSLSHPELLMRHNEYPWTKDKLPMYPGANGCGIVEQVGKNVTNFKKGDKVFCTHYVVCGCHAEYKVVPEDKCWLLPDTIDMKVVSANFSHLVVWCLLTIAVPHSEGKTLYIKSAAGAMGTAVLQFGQYLGINVIASASTDEKCEFLKSLNTGATVFNYNSCNEKEKVMELTNGNGADIVMDQIVGEQFIENMDLIADNGTVLIYNHKGGFPSGNIIKAMTEDGYARCLGIKVYSQHFLDKRPELLNQKTYEVFDLIDKGVAAPLIGYEFPLSQIREANELLDSGKFFGNIVINCDYT